MKIALYQSEGVPGDVAANLAAMEGAAARAAAGGAALLICPEMHLTGYNIGKRAWELAEPQAGPAGERAAAMARAHAIALLYGYPERDGDAVYNAAALIDDSGARLANYRKTHLYGDEEKRLFRAGDSFVTCGLGGLRLGILICYDIEFPEAARTLALAGAELIAVPTALAEADRQVPARLVPARAYENQIFVAYANRCGSENGMRFSGESRVSAPDGRDLALAGRDEDLLLAEIEPVAYARSRAANSYLDDRRPELYRDPESGADD